MNALLRSAALASLALTCMARADAGTLVLESWRTDDKTLWDTVLLPAFTKKIGRAHV